MSIYRRPKDPSYYYSDEEIKDGKLIQKSFEKHGHEVSLLDALWAWEEYCSDVCASWMIVPDIDRERDAFICCSKFLVACKQNE